MKDKSSDELEDSTEKLSDELVAVEFVTFEPINIYLTSKRTTSEIFKFKSKLKLKDDEYEFVNEVESIVFVHISPN